MSRLSCWFLPAAAAASAAQAPPDAAPRPELVLLVGTVHPVARPAFADGVLVVGGGRILAVGPRGEVAIPPGVPVTSLPGAHAYPGLIDAWSQSFLPPGGLGEGNAGLETQAGLETVAAEGAALAAAGIVTAHVLPAASGRWLGIGALVRPRASGWSAFAADGGGAEVLRLTGAAGQHAVQRRKDLGDLGRVFEEAEAYAKARARHAEATAKYDKEWQAYLEEVRKGSKPADSTGASEEAKGGDPPPPNGDGAARSEARRPTFPKAVPPDPARDALQRVAEGRLRLWIEAQRSDEIEAALGLVQDRHVRHACLLGALAGDKMLDPIAGAGVGVVLVPEGRPAELDGEPAGAGLALGLHRKGIPFAIASANPRRARALTLMAAACVGEGVPEAAAVRAITLTPAELLGIAGETGSLERGKRADIVITSAPLLRSDARVLHVLADGQTIHRGR